MKFTIGIITSFFDNQSNLNKIFESISNNTCYDDIEVLVIGGNKNEKHRHYRFISFNESIKDRWITRKKNIITQEAKYDNIVYMHDYIYFMPNWFEAMEDFGESWNILMNPIINYNGDRFRDWSLWPHDLDNVWGKETRKCLLPYNVTNLSKLMYISGAYWIAKKNIMEEFPLNENLTWGMSEDVEWSKRVRKQYEFSINKNSYVKLLKYKDPIFTEIDLETLKIVQKYNETL